MGISNYIIWIDPNICNFENTLYFVELAISFNSVRSFTNVEEAINFLKSIKFVETKIIVSGKLYIDFVRKFQENIYEMNIIPKIIIFTYHKDLFIQNNQLLYENIIKHPFYNFGGIQTNFNEILNFIKEKPKLSLNQELNELRDNIRYEFHDNAFTQVSFEQMTFEYIDSKEKLLLPLFYKILIEMPFESSDSRYYTLSLYSRFSRESNDIKNLLNQIILIKFPPIELLCKYYIRAYTMDTSFYIDINRELRYNRIIENLTFIKLLYAGIKLKSIPLASEEDLYRGTQISETEIGRIEMYLKEKRKDLPGAIVFSKSFLSFSKTKQMALKFSNNRMTNFSRVLFILRRDNNIGYSLATHADIEKISFYPEEKEVLFFPFSSFEIRSINNVENTNYEYEIELLYLGKYVKEIAKDKNITEKANKIPNSKFKKDIIKSGLIPSEKIEKNNTKKIFADYEKYKKDISNIKTIFKDVEKEKDDKKVKKQIEEDVKEEEEEKLKNMKKMKKKIK